MKAIKIKIKKVFKNLIEWAFSDELAEIRKTSEETRASAERIKNILHNMDVSVDVHHYSPSWAVISIQGQKSDYIKFVELPAHSIREIQRFLSAFDRAKVDCSPMERHHFTRGRIWRI